eukprot:4804213-Pleurochrysis_carterae.AAC.1
MHALEDARDVASEGEEEGSGSELRELRTQLVELQAAVGVGTPATARTPPSSRTPRATPRSDPSLAAWQSVEA